MDDLDAVIIFLIFYLGPIFPIVCGLILRLIFFILEKLTGANDGYSTERQSGLQEMAKIAVGFFIWGAICGLICFYIVPTILSNPEMFNAEQTSWPLIVWGGLLLLAFSVFGIIIPDIIKRRGGKSTLQQSGMIGFAIGLLVMIFYLYIR